MDLNSLLEKISKETSWNCEFVLCLILNFTCFLLWSFNQHQIRYQWKYYSIRYSYRYPSSHPVKRVLGSSRRLVNSKGMLEVNLMLGISWLISPWPPTHRHGLKVNFLNSEVKISVLKRISTIGLEKSAQCLLQKKDGPKHLP